MSDPSYVLGHSERELKRLTEQGRFYGDLTADLLHRAGLEPGMRVLDVGSGAGDVSFLAASMIGARGHVVGIDKSPEAVAVAQQRAARAALSRVTFEVADAQTYLSQQPFDAIVGRLVLVYQADPSAVLRSLARNLRPGGLLAFEEMEVSIAKSVPALPLFSRCVGWLTEAFTRSGIQVDMGTRLYAAFRSAGLASPSMFLLSRVEGADKTATYENLVQTLRSLLPAMERFGIASASDVQIDTLTERLVREAQDADAVVLPPAAVGAWLRVP
jgi:ubiquinone/menaquinone biosynthesis C-methylase UbiE